MRFLKYLFLQHNDGTGVPFPSKFMRLHGDLFYGKPADRGLDTVSEDLQRTYSYNKTERGVSTDFEDEMERLQTNIWRKTEEPHCSASASFAGIPVVIALAIGAAFVTGAHNMANKLEASISSPSAVASEPNLPDNNRCLLVRAMIRANQPVEAEMKGVAPPAFWKQCAQLGITQEIR